MKIFKYIIVTVISIVYIDAGLGMKNPSNGIPSCWIRTTGALEFGALKEPEKGEASHASTGAVSFEDVSGKERTNYICNLNFISCASDSYLSGSLPAGTKPCLASKSDPSKSSHPRLDSEPAFLEYLTSAVDPVKDGI